MPDLPRNSSPTNLLMHQRPHCLQLMSSEDLRLSAMSGKVSGDLLKSVIKPSQHQKLKWPLCCLCINLGTATLEVLLRKVSWTNAPSVVGIQKVDATSQWKEPTSAIIWPSASSGINKNTCITCIKKNNPVNNCIFLRPVNCRECADKMVNYSEYETHLFKDHNLSGTGM